MSEIEPTLQDPCDWCLGEDPHLLLCQCRIDCGQDDCPFAERDLYYRPSVPDFGISRVHVFEPPTQPYAVPEAKTDAEAALTRVLDLHQKCACKGCAPGITRAACTGCHDFWPCKTVQVVRGFAFKYEGELL